MSTSRSPHGPIRLALSVDDLFQWRGMPFPEGYSAESVARSLIEAFDDNDIPSVYAFSCTAPTEDDPTLLSVLDLWSGAGNNVGNHTHHHASLNWLTAEQYIEDIERSERVLDEWLENAPSRYFRFSLDMWGDTAEKTAQVTAHLAKSGYMPCPVSTWFYDAQFISPYLRALAADDDEGRRWVQDKVVQAAVSQLISQDAAAREVHGRSPAHIGLLHGTPVMGDTIARVIEAYRELGVEFITLEEAMRDPANAVPPPLTTRMFRNFTQKWAEASGVEIDGTPPRDLLAEVREFLPREGLSEEEVIGAVVMQAVAPFGVEPTLDEFDW